MRRVITVQVGWLVLAAVLVLVALFVLAVRRPSAAPPPAGVDPGPIRSACAQYAALDLSGWAAVCRAAGYQQRVYVQPTGAPAWWPTVRRGGVVVQPEDLDRDG